MILIESAQFKNLEKLVLRILPPEEAEVRHLLVSGALEQLTQIRELSLDLNFQRSGNIYFGLSEPSAEQGGSSVRDLLEALVRMPQKLRTFHFSIASSQAPLAELCASLQKFLAQQTELESLSLNFNGTP